MRGRESVVDIDVAELGERPREIGRILLFTLVEAKVFKKRHLPELECCDDPLRLVAYAVCSEGDLSTADRLAQRRHQRP